MQIVILKRHKQLLMDVLRRSCYLGKSFNLTEINTSIFVEIFGWLEKTKSKNEMHWKYEEVFLVL